MLKSLPTPAARRISISGAIINEPKLQSPPTSSTPALSLVPRESKTEERPQLCRMSDLLGAWEGDAQTAYIARSTGMARGPVTGLSTLDRELGGYFSPGVHIAHGQPGAGKTAFALQIAASCGTPCLYLSCEMAALELLRRLTARTTGTYLGRLKSGELLPQESLALARRGCLSAPELALVDGTRAYASPNYLHECAIITRGDATNLLIVVDSLHSWAESAPATGATEYDTLNVALSSLRRLSHALACPILAIAERNRDTMKGGGLSAGAGTRKIEYGAETVIDLERSSETKEDTNGEVEVRAKLCKNRNGAAGRSLGLRFHGALQKFSVA